MRVEQVEDVANGYALRELMIIEAARHISNGDVVMVGSGLPMVATTFAIKTHAPDLVAVVESGPIDPLIVQTPISVSDPRVMHKAARLGSLREVLGCVLQRGLVDVGFIGGAQIDQYGNINSTVIGDYLSPKVRLPGSGGANDIASHAKRLLIIVAHEQRRFPTQCDYITSPGYLSGPGARNKVGLKVSAPPITVVTSLSVMETHPETGLLSVTKLMPGVKLETVYGNTGFRPSAAAVVETVTPPSEHDLRILRDEVDPEGVYVRQDRKSRSIG
ncbi:MAG: CoA-transferase subunit beta [Acidiferrobacterales bacterium]